MPGALTVDTVRMRVLTLHAEWIPTFTHMGKRVENRSWKAPAAVVGERIALHAGKSWPGPGSDRWFSFRMTAAQEGYLVTQHSPGVIEYADVCDKSFTPIVDVPLGSIALLATVRACYHIDNVIAGTPWSFGPWCWALEDIRRLREPIPAKGHQGLWWTEIPAHAIATAEAVSDG